MEAVHVIDKSVLRAETSSAHTPEARPTALMHCLVRKLAVQGGEPEAQCVACKAALLSTAKHFHAMLAYRKNRIWTLRDRTGGDCLAAQDVVPAQHAARRPEAQMRARPREDPAVHRGGCIMSGACL